MDTQELAIKDAVKRIFEKMATEGEEDCHGEDLLAQYVEETLDEDRIAEVQEHLACCDVCLDTVIEFQRWKEIEVEALEHIVPEATTRRSIDLVHRDAITTKEVLEDSLSEKSAAQERSSPYDVILRCTRGVFELIKKTVEITPIHLEPMMVPTRGPEAPTEVDEKSTQVAKKLYAFSKELEKVTAEVVVEVSDDGLYELSVRIYDTNTGVAMDGFRVILTNKEYELESARTLQGAVCFEGHEGESYNLEVMDADSTVLGTIRLKIEAG